MPREKAQLYADDAEKGLIVISLVHGAYAVVKGVGISEPKFTPLADDVRGVGDAGSLNSLDSAGSQQSARGLTNSAPDVPDNVPYFRVQGRQGARPGQVSQERLSVNADGTVSINPECSGQLCVSVEGPDHAAYYLSNNRPDGTVVVFEVDRATHNRIMEAAVDQNRARSAPVQITDRNTPGTSIQLNDVFAELMASGSSKGRVLSQQEFLNEFGGN